ncbi:hypothetical protein [Helicobacter rodentium]|uniref:hypothetical protein n=1 Tax=Helicobacter rodentium TaxID=59617 RepID=UPI0012ECA60F|nr:hypothetical protein [Helicobacter rodentium]
MKSCKDTTASLRSVRRSAQSASSAHTCKSIIKHKVNIAMESLRKCIIIDCHSLLRGFAMTEKQDARENLKL